MKNFLLGFLMLFSITTIAQDSTKNVSVNTSFILSSKNLWRGIVYGNNTPSLQSTLALDMKNFELGACGTISTTGTKKGFGTWMELYAGYTLGRFNFTVDDYFFFNEADSLNDYFNYSQGSTQHLVEGRVKYSVDKFNLMASYVLYAATGAKNSLYLEAEYFIIPELSILMGYVAGESYLNFYNNAGITHIGVAGTRKIKITKDFSLPVRAVVATSPNYKNVANYDGLSRNPINFVLSLTF